MTFNVMTVKELIENPKTAAVIKEYAPAVLKLPLKPLHNKSAAELIDSIVQKGILPKEVAAQIEAKVNEVIK